MTTEEKIKEIIDQVVDGGFYTKEGVQKDIVEIIIAEKIKAYEHLLKKHLTASIVFENGYPVRGVPQVEILNEIAFLKNEKAREEGKEKGKV